MQNWLKAVIAGIGAKKLGGGCLSTVLIFVIIYYALGQCNRPATNNPPPVKQTSLREVIDRYPEQPGKRNISALPVCKIEPVQ